MKKYLIPGILLVAVLSPALLFCQEIAAPDQAVAIDPVWLLVNTYKGSYEQRITKQISGQLEIAYSPDFVWGLHEYNKLTYLDVILQGRYYVGSLLKEQAKDVDIASANDYLMKIFTDALGGLYVGVFGGYVNAGIEVGEDIDFQKYQFNGAGGGLELGVKYIFGERNTSFFIEPYGVIQFYAGGWAYEDYEGNKISKPVGFEDGFDRNGLSGGINIGLTF